MELMEIIKDMKELKDYSKGIELVTMLSETTDFRKNMQKDMDFERDLREFLKDYNEFLRNTVGAEIIKENEIIADFARNKLTFDIRYKVTGKTEKMEYEDMILLVYVDRIVKQVANEMKGGK